VRHGAKPRPALTHHLHGPHRTYNPQDGRGSKKPATQEQAMQELVDVVQVGPGAGGCGRGLGVGGAAGRSMAEWGKACVMTMPLASLVRIRALKALLPRRDPQVKL
jgi:hypothetical protein